MKKLKLVVVSAALVIGGLSVSALARGHGGMKHRGAMLEKFDADQDGKLDAAEKAKLVEAREAMRANKRAAALAKFDANKDGKLDAAEKAAMRDLAIEQRFAKLDTNKDGVISLDEMKAGKHGKGFRKGGKRGMRRGGGIR